jgi:AraC-like DNA-binding protein
MRNLFFHTLNEKETPFSVVAVGERESETFVSRDREYLGAHLMLSKKGRGVLEMNGARYMLEENVVFLIEAGAPHTYYPYREPWHTAWIVFRDDRALLRGLLPPSGFPFRLGGDLYAKYHGWIYEQARADTIASAYKASALLYALATELVCERQCGRGAQGARTSALDAALDFIHRNFDADVGLRAICAAAGVSGQYLCRAFQARLKISPYEYLIACRIRRAKELMADRRLTVGQIGALVGFRDASYFCHVFRRREKIPPKKFRDAFYP